MGLAWDPNAAFKTKKKHGTFAELRTDLFKGMPKPKLYVTIIYDYCGILWCLMANHCCNVDNFIAVSFLINSASTMASEHTAYIYVMIVVVYLLFLIFYNFYYILLCIVIIVILSNSCIVLMKFWQCDLYRTAAQPCQ